VQAKKLKTKSTEISSLHLQNRNCTSLTLNLPSDYAVWLLANPVNHCRFLTTWFLEPEDGSEIIPSSYKEPLGTKMGRKMFLSLQDLVPLERIKKKKIGI